MDGLDLIVGAVVSAAVAGLGAAVIAYVSSTVSRSAWSTAMVAWTIGAVFIYGSYALLVDLPERDDLVALSPATVRLAYVDKSVDGEVLRFQDASGQSLTIDPRKGYYANLVAAVNAGQLYRVLYAREHALLSGDERLHTVIYDVSVNGVTLESYERRSSQLRLLCSGAFAFGLVMVLGGCLAPRYVGRRNLLRVNRRVSA